MQLKVKTHISSILQIVQNNVQARLLLVRHRLQPFIVRRSLALMLRVVRVGHWGSVAALSVRLRQSSALRSPHNKSLAPAALHTGHSVLITPTLSLRQERESCLLCPVAPLFSLRWKKCGDGGGTWSGPGHPHLTHPSPSLTLTACFTLDHTSLMTSPGLSIRQTDISGGPICIVSGAPCVMSHDQAGAEAFLVTKYTTER